MSSLISWLWEINSRTQLCCGCYLDSKGRENASESISALSFSQIPFCCCWTNPTSDLDSTSAVALTKLLQKLCRSENKIFITSFHQPSSEAVFHCFEKLLMLEEGRVVYCPSRRWLAWVIWISKPQMGPKCSSSLGVDILIRDNLIEGMSSV